LDKKKIIKTRMNNQVIPKPSSMEDDQVPPPIYSTSSLVRGPDGEYLDQTNSMWMCLTYSCIACCGCFAFVRNEPNEDIVVLYWGNYQQTIKTPGEHFLPSKGRHMFAVDTKQQTLTIPRAVVTDADGTNLLLDALITWRVVDSAKACLVVQNYYDYLRSQGEVVMRKVAAANSYHNMKTDAQHIANDMKNMLQHRIEPAGLAIMSMELINIQFNATLMGIGGLGGMGNVGGPLAINSNMNAMNSMMMNPQMMALQQQQQYMQQMAMMQAMQQGGQQQILPPQGGGGGYQQPMQSPPAGYQQPYQQPMQNPPGYQQPSAPTSK